MQQNQRNPPKTLGFFYFRLGNIGRETGRNKTRFSIRRQCPPKKNKKGFWAAQKPYEKIFQLSGNGKPTEGAGGWKNFHSGKFRNQSRAARFQGEGKAQVFFSVGRKSGRRSIPPCGRPESILRGFSLGGHTRHHRQGEKSSRGQFWKNQLYFYGRSFPAVSSAEEKTAFQELKCVSEHDFFMGRLHAPNSNGKPRKGAGGSGIQRNAPTVFSEGRAAPVLLDG